jgi:uncharacterized OB-fold protein
MSKDILKPFKSILMKEFWEGITHSQLLTQQCSKCQERFFPPRARCPKCLNDHLSWIPLSGRGKIQSWTRMEFPVVHPYYIAVIDLDESIGRIIGRINSSGREPRIGDSVRISYFLFKDDPLFEFVLDDIPE